VQASERAHPFGLRFHLREDALLALSWEYRGDGNLEVQAKIEARVCGLLEEPKIAPETQLAECNGPWSSVANSMTPEEFARIAEAVAGSE
jgi:hypothetical protein